MLSIILCILILATARYLITNINQSNYTVVGVDTVVDHTDNDSTHSSDAKQVTFSDEVQIDYDPEFGWSQAVLRESRVGPWLKMADQRCREYKQYLEYCERHGDKPVSWEEWGDDDWGMVSVTTHSDGDIEDDNVKD